MGTQVIIIGAGPAGLCLALAFARRGLNVAILERQSAEVLAAPDFDGREIALTHASMRLLRELGVWQHLPAAKVSPLRRAQVMDGATGFEVEPTAFAREQLGTLVSNCQIRAAAWAAASNDPRIHIRAGTAVEAVGSMGDAAWVRLVNGERHQAPLLVAADSRFSETRRAMGISARMHDFGKTMVVCRMRHAEPHHGVALEWFGNGQTRALLPLRENLASIVLTVTGSEARRLQQLPAGEFGREIETRFEHRLGAMELASTIHTYPLVATWAQRFIAHRFALAGDAAVGMHPVTAHGFNLGLASVEHLAQAVGDAVAWGRDPADPALLARYQRRHRRASLPLFVGTNTVAGLFTDDRAIAQPLRQAIVQAGKRLPPLRRALAAGLTDERIAGASPLRVLHLGLNVLRPRARAM
jgi:ubiquinone biosynthesis UbiH/UbiF/VisC/COQ6 family hydroxylase